MSRFLALVLAAGLPLAGWTAHGFLLWHRLTEARRDPVTGLWTRKAWTTRAERMLARNPYTTVLLCDLNDFKAVNDEHGHAAGDAVLIETARRLARLTGDDGIVGRLGGDEFAIVCGDSLDETALTALRRILARPVGYDGRELAVSASVGACPTARLSVRTLSAALWQADVAMYADKGAAGRRGRPATGVDLAGGGVR